MMSIGFLAELITAYKGRDEDSYSIAERTPAVASAEPAVDAPRSPVPEEIESHP
jgi:hypothetical protein